LYGLAKGRKMSNIKQIVNPVFLVIDMQKDFCSEDGLFKRKGYKISRMKNIAPRIVQMIVECKRLSIPVLFIKSYYDKKYLPKNIYEMYKRKGLERLCCSGTEGAKLYKINPKDATATFIKHRYDAFTNPDLERWLCKHHIKTLILSGCQTDVCVDCTARSGFMKGFNIVALKDCLASSDYFSHYTALAFMKKYCAAIIRSSRTPLRRVMKGDNNV